MNNIFTERLKELLQYSNKKQVDICQEMNISKQKLTKWKHGYNEPSLDDLMLIASYFDVSVDYLIGMKSEKDNDEKFI